MSFTWFADKPLRSREQVMEIIVRVADDMQMPDRKGACIIAGMTVAVEVGADRDGDNIPEFWCPANPTNDPETLKYENDSYSDDSKSSGYFQQQPPWWGTAAQRMDPYESCKLFMTSLKRYPYKASNAQEAGSWAQKVQGSSHPDRYAKWWQLANDVYNNVKGTPPAPVPPQQREPYGMPRGSNSGGYGNTGVKFPAWVYALGNAFGLKPSTYPGHQEGNRNEAGYAPNPQGLNRGIDWASPGAADEIDRMTRFADYLATIPHELEQVIWQNPKTMRSIEVAGGRHQPGYFRADLAGHRNHVHTRQSQSISIPGGAIVVPAPQAPPSAIHTTGDPVWLADVLRTEGLTVVEMPGWRDRGHGDFSDIRGIMVHHTGSNNASAESIAYHPTLGLASQLHLARNGVWTVCGAGIAWHAGQGGGIPWLPNNDANRYTIGIEAANDGGVTPGKPHRSSWPDVQYDSYTRGCAAIARKLGHNQDRVIAHKEWAGKTQGKWDPGAIDMNIFRADVAARIRTTTLPPSYTGDIFMALTDAEQREILEYLRWMARPGTGELRKKFESRSDFAEPDEGEVDSWAGMDLNTDGNVDFLATYLRATLKFPPAIERLKKVARDTRPERQLKADLASAVLAKITAPQQASSTTAAVDSQWVSPSAAEIASAISSMLPPASDGAALAAAYSEIAQLREQNARLLAEKSVPSMTVAPQAKIVVTPGKRNAGDIVSSLVTSSMDYTEFLLSLNAEERTSILQALKTLDPPKGN